MKIKGYETIYGIAQYILDEIVADMPVKFSFEKMAQNLHNFLTKDNTKYEIYFDYDYGYPLDENTKIYKVLMMLLIADTSFKFNLHDVTKGLLEEEDSLLPTLKEMNYDEVINLFLSDDEEDKQLVKEMILDYLEYCDLGYLMSLECAKMVLDQDLLSTLTQINPFAILNYIDIIKQGWLKNYEQIIQNGIDAYDYSCMITAKREEMTEEAVNKADFNEAFIEKMLEYCEDDEEKLYHAICYMIANVYEYCIVDCLTDETKKIIDIIKRNKDNQAELARLFYNDEEFCHNIITIFYSANENINEDSLTKRNKKFNKKTKNDKVLKLISRYYE